MDGCAVEPAVLCCQWVVCSLQHYQYLSWHLHHYIIYYINFSYNPRLAIHGHNLGSTAGI
jgi:hypothetical protein